MINEPQHYLNRQTVSVQHLLTFPFGHKIIETYRIETTQPKIYEMESTNRPNKHERAQQQRIMGKNNSGKVENQ